MKKKILSAAASAVVAAAAAAVLIPSTAFADNPIVQTSFTPDPAPVVFGDELYVFTGCDRDGKNDFYKMTGWQCFSTKDMKNWTDHGRILEDTTFSWCGQNDAWASQCIERNGKYYFYFTTTYKGQGRAIGVAVADSPEGPYEDVLGKPLCGPDWAYIDPTVMIDDDGQAWLMFGNPTCYYVKLNEDMVSLGSDIKQFDMTPQQFGPASGDHKTSYGEGPWICKHDNLYYLVWASFVSGYGGESQCYATGPSVTGPWTYGGVIQQGSNSFTTHGGIIDYKGHSYFFYHKSGIPGGSSYNRSASVEEFTFNSDGSIPVMKLTNNGPDQIEALNPFIRNEAETICWSEGLKTEKCSEGGVDLCNIENGDYVKVAGVDFGSGADKFTASVASNTSGGTIELHIDSKNGPLVGACRVSGTSGWQNWEEVSTDVVVDGEHDLYFVFKGDSGYLMNVDWWKFEGDGSSEVTTDPVEKPEGYIFENTFDRGTENWSGRGGAKVSTSKTDPYEGSGCISVTGREAAWNGVIKKLGSEFKAGETYSFSVNAKYTTGKDQDKFHFSLQYDNANGDPEYAKIATVNASKGQWFQLANQNFTLPKDGSNFAIYVETDKSTIDFFIDDAIAAVAGTKIAGAKGGTFCRGDITGDGKINGYDLIAARRSLISGNFPKNCSSLNADVNDDGEFNITDVTLLNEYVLGKITEFPLVEKPHTAMTMAEFTQICQEKLTEKEPDSSHQERSGVQYGTIKGATYYSKTANRQKKYNILLPAGYSEDKKYPVLYVLHGYYENPDRMIIKGNGTMYTRQIIGNAIASGEAKDMIVVFPDVFSHPTMASCTNMDDENNYGYDNFINDLKNDLMPEIESKYSVLTGKDNTAITGFSMGGRESLLIGMKMPETFGYVGAICPAPGVEGTFNWDDDNSPYLLHITAGSNDTVVYDNPKNYHNNFTKNGVPHIWHYVNGGYHGDNSIHAHIYNFVREVFQATT